MFRNTNSWKTFDNLTIPLQIKFGDQNRDNWLASCFLKATENPELRARYGDIEADARILKDKILQGGDTEADVKAFEQDLENIVEKYKEIVGKNDAAL